MSTNSGSVKPWAELTWAGRLLRKTNWIARFDGKSLSGVVASHGRAIRRFLDSGIISLDDGRGSSNPDGAGP